MPKEPSQTELVTTGSAVMRAPQVNTEIAVRDPESLLRYALDKNADVGVIERLMAVRKELQAEAAKAAFDAAMRDFQAECPVIHKNRAVPDAAGRVAYSYSPLEDILTQVRPLLQKHGFSFTLDTDTESKDGWVIAKCKVTHCAGHCETSTAKFPLGTGTRMMSQTQVFASALTFASRRVFCNSFGIVTGGEDMDGRTSEQKPAGPSKLAPAETSLKDLAAELWTVLKPVRGEAKSWIQANQWLWKFELLDGATDEAAPNLTAERFREVITKAKAIITQPK